MNESPQPVQPSSTELTPDRLATLRQLTLVTYILYALSCVTGVTAIAALVINYLKRDEVQGTIYASHFTWQIRTFWVATGVAVLGALTWFACVGAVVLAADGVWVIYRLVKGFLAFNENKAVENPLGWL